MTLDEIAEIALDREGFERFFSCYRAAQTGAAPAAQSALPMRQLAKLMPHITLLEWRAPEEIIFKLAGDSIVERLGFNPAGANFLDLLHPDQRAGSVEGHQIMLAHQCGCYLLYESEFESGACATLETITLPMRKTDSDDPKLFISFHSHQSTSSFSENREGTALVSDWRWVEHADVGCGEPAELPLIARQKSKLETA